MQTLSGAVATAIVRRVAEQRALSTSAGVTLAEAGMALRYAADMEALRQRDRYEGCAEGLATTSYIATVDDALAAGIRYVDTFGDAPVSKPNPWNTIGHIQSNQPFAALHALAGAQVVTVNGEDTYLPIDRKGRPVSAKRERSARKAVRAMASANRKGATTMTAAERKALSRWRSVARKEGFVCVEHGPTLKGCGTDCRTAALNLTTTNPTSAVIAVSSDSWDRDQR